MKRFLLGIIVGVTAGVTTRAITEPFMHPEPVGTFHGRLSGHRVFVPTKAYHLLHKEGCDNVFEDEWLK